MIAGEGHISVDDHKPGWRDVSPGGLITRPGSAREYQTGEWRTERPVYDPDHCIQCLLCWVYCPDSAIEVDDGRVVGVDYDHCKGCGICVRECPRTGRALEMRPENIAR